ncbi:MAG: CGNR zinc finger domain-containing protein [Anaeromyxobacter sp.]|nr:CGNR zinc finger domain-containing protein [Anaeromyxobacter sp.]MBL0274646.1 CGNR zinc finger domain-containing protein [Anaeromyxobacter sp.]
MAYAFTAGDLGLDFVNTLERHAGRAPEEVLTSWRELVDWAARAGVAGPQVAGRLRALGVGDRRTAQAVFRRALQLRDCLYELVTAHLARRRPRTVHLRRFNGFLAEAQAAVVLRAAAGGLAFDLPVTAERPASLLGPVVMAAARLLTSPETVALIRRCDAENCRQFFVDRSKNHSRRWCDMKLCGNRAKAREFYRQHRGRG